MKKLFASFENPGIIEICGVILFFWLGAFMKKLSIVFITGLLLSSSIFQVHAVRLKLDYIKDSESNLISKNFPTKLISHIGEYLTINESLEIAFTSKKQDACDFDVEECVRTLLGTAHYRIIFHDTVLIWDNDPKQFYLVTKDDKISPLKCQIQWFTCFKWLSNSKSMDNTDSLDIKLTME